VCVDFHHEEPFIEVEGSLYQLNQVGLEEMDGWAAIHMAGRPLLLGSTDFQRWIPLVKQCSSVTIKSRAELTQRLAGRARGWAGWLTPRPTWPGVWPTWSTCHLQPYGADNFDIDQLHFVIP
jgi:hypothetical protein